MTPASPSILAAEGYPLTMHAADLCRLLGIHENTLYRRIKRGDVPAWTRGTGYRTPREWRRPDVERWWLQRRPQPQLQKASGF